MLATLLKAHPNLWPIVQRTLGLTSEENVAQNISWEASIVALCASLLISSLGTAFLAQPRVSLTWLTLAIHTSALLVSAAILAVATQWMIHGLLLDYLGTQPSCEILGCAVGAALWCPMLMLLNHQDAIWRVAAPIPICLILGRYFILRSGEISASEDTPHARSKVLFNSDDSSGFSFPSWQPLIAAFLLVSTLVAATAQRYVWAQLLEALFGLLLVIMSTRNHKYSTTIDSRPRLHLLSVVACFILTSISLTPYLHSNLQSLGLERVMSVGIPAPVHRQVARDSFTGFILTTLPEKRHEHIDPPKRRSSTSGGVQKEQVIPFDGVYWFYENDLDRPGPDAPIQRGNPLHSNIRSTGFIPLAMEAHQHLGQRISGDCCVDFAIDLRDGDNRVGSISVEAVLQDTSAPNKPSFSLGTSVIKASTEAKISLFRQPVEERLHFSMSRLPSQFLFDEITLHILPASGRDLAAAKIQIKGFILRP